MREAVRPRASLLVKRHALRRILSSEGETTGGARHVRNNELRADLVGAFKAVKIG